MFRSALDLGRFREDKPRGLGMVRDDLGMLGGGTGRRAQAAGGEAGGGSGSGIRVGPATRCEWPASGLARRKVAGSGETEPAAEQILSAPNCSLSRSPGLLHLSLSTGVLTINLYLSTSPLSIFFKKNP
jgi:hypothetical protein